ECNILVVSGTLSSSKSQRVGLKEHRHEAHLSHLMRRKPWSCHSYHRRGPSGDLVVQCGRIHLGKSGQILSMRRMNWSHSSRGRLSCLSRGKHSGLASAKRCLFPPARVTRFATLVRQPIAGALAISTSTKKDKQEQGRDIK